MKLKKETKNKKVTKKTEEKRKKRKIEKTEKPKNKENEKPKKQRKPIGNLRKIWLQTNIKKMHCACVFLPLKHYERLLLHIYIIESNNIVLPSSQNKCLNFNITLV